MIQNITEHGAVGDGQTLCTDSIQRAIDAAAEQGGAVLVPPGTYVTGTIELRSGVTLDIRPGATLLGSPNIDDYRQVAWGQHIDRTPWHLLLARDCRDVTITGGGTIDGHGPAFWEPCTNDPAAGAQPVDQLDPITCTPARQTDPDKAPITWIHANKEQRPSPMIEITGCENVRISDVHITNSAGWNVHLHNSRYCWLRGIKLTCNLMGPNNDGFDITGCSDVFVSDCDISCCDDAIVLKTTPDSQPVQRVTVTNCVLRTPCAALKCGASESFHDFRQITFSNCVVYESNRAVALYSLEGATIEDIAISNIVCDTRNRFLFNRPIHLDCRRKKPDSKLGKIRNISVSNFIAKTDGRLLMTGRPDSPLENITLRDVHVQYPTIDDPAMPVEVGVGQFSAQSPEARAARGVIVAEHVSGLAVDGLRVTWPQTDADGKVQTPDEWRMKLKTANGTHEHFPREKFNTDRIPPFAVLWGRGLCGGYLHSPLARPAPGAERCDLQDSNIDVH